MNSTLTNYRSDIDGLRGVAVGLVVLFHAFPSYLQGGFVGVDVFFVISGYLITSLIVEGCASGRFSFADFYARRIRRLFPALVLVMSTCLVAGWFLLLPDEFTNLGKQVAAGVGFISNFVLWSESGYFDKAAETKPLLHLWSLAIEEQFYLVWPALVVLVTRRGRSVLKLGVAIAVVSFLFNAVGVHFTGIRHDAIATFYAPYTRVWELMAGAILAQVHVRLSARIANLASLSGITLILLGALLLSKDVYFPGMGGLLPVVGAALLIAAGPQGLVNRVVLSTTALVSVGRISYPLYLWHWPLLVLGPYMFFDFTALHRIAAVIAAAMLAWATYAWVERPLRFGKHGTAKALALAGFMIILGVAGLAIGRSDGLPGRFPALAFLQTEFKHDHDAWILGNCQLGPKRPADCPPEIVAGKKTLLLWGDSHAGHLGPGFRREFGQTFNIVQRAAGSCPPILDPDYRANLPRAESEFCGAINDETFALAKELKPDRVVLAASWGAYHWRKIETTLKALRAEGIRDIYVVGPVPVWQTTLPKELHKFYTNTIPHRLPDRMKVGINGVSAGPFETDREMAEFFRGRDVTYISAIEILCNEEGCLTFVDAQRRLLVTIDSAHLTLAGSSLVVSRFPR